MGLPPPPPPAQGPNDWAYGILKIFRFSAQKLRFLHEILEIFNEKISDIFKKIKFTIES